jgi:hypothetical protein
VSSETLIRYASDLQEAVVLRAIERRAKEGDRTAADDYRKAADRIYARHDDAESRRAAFQALHAQMFETLGCGRPIVEALERLGLRFGAVLVTRAWSPTEEEAGVGIDGTTLGIRLMGDRFGSPDFLRLLYHELGHVTDMLDPAFGYGLSQASSARAARRRAEERFSILWDCVVDGRTARAGSQPLAPKSDRCAEFARLFPEFTPDVAEIVVGLLWGGARPTYAELAAFTRDPQALAFWCGLPSAVGAASAQSAGRVVPVPGAPCPLCGFPTFAWEHTIPEAIAERIAADFPTWSPARGACERCVEGYTVMADVGGLR